MRDVLELSTATMAPVASRETPVLPEELVILRSPWSFEADQYRALRHRIEAAGQPGEIKVVAVTSPAAGEGKTVTALNLAGALAQTPGTRVLVIDGDFRRPAVGQYLRLAKTAQAGLAAALAGEQQRLGPLTRRLESLNLSVVPAGRARDRSYELISSDRMQVLLDEARASYDYVIVDTPPLLPLPDARAMARWVDGFVLVVAAHTTTKAAAAEALRLIQPARLLAVAFNGDDRRLPSSYRYYAAARANEE
jgi:capsular exopolysaccharide synthesis family protein